MRIGIDVTPLPAQPVGAGVYMIQLVRALAMLEDASTLVVIAQSGGRQLIENSPLPNVEWVDVGQRRPAARLVWEQSALPGLARRLGLDVLHSLHYTSPYRLKCASVVTFHDMTFFLFPQLHTRAKRLFFPLAMRLSARTAEAIIADSENTRRDAQAILHIPSDKLHAIPCGISPEFRRIEDQQALADCRRRYALPQQFILYVGTVEPRKNLPLLLKAYAALGDVAAGLPLVIVGRKGWMFDEVFIQVKTLGIDDRVRFTGYIPGEDLPLVYNLAQIFVYPSLYEGFGFPPLEAMACGTPVITSAISAMRDQVGDAGLLTAPGDIDALCAALRALAVDPDLRRELAQKGRRRAADFTWARTAHRTLQVYRLAADRR